MRRSPRRRLVREMPRHPVTGGRVGPPTSGVPGSLYDFVRRYLCDNGGSSSRGAIEAALVAEPQMREKLFNSRGFHSLISNMHHSGDVELDGATVRATGRTYRRLGVRPPSTALTDAGKQTGGIRPKSDAMAVKKGQVDVAANAST